MGGVIRIVPPLNRTLLKKHASAMQQIQEAAQSPESANASAMFDLQCDMVLDALRLNYPDLSQEAFDDVVDMANIQEAFPACLGHLAAVSEAKAKNAMAVSHSGSLTGVPTPPAS